MLHCMPSSGGCHFFLLYEKNNYREIFVFSFFYLTSAMKKTRIFFLHYIYLADFNWSINHSIDWSFWLIDWLHRLQSIRYGFIGFIFSYFLAINCGLNKRKIEIEKIESANNTHTTISKMFPVNRKKVKALTITMGNFSSSFSPILIDLCTKISMICMCKWRINQNRKRTEQIFTIDSKYGHLDMTIFGQTDVIIIISHFHSFFFFGHELIIIIIILEMIEANDYVHFSLF